MPELIALVAGEGLTGGLGLADWVANGSPVNRGWAVEAYCGREAAPHDNPGPLGDSGWFTLCRPDVLAV